MPGFILQLGSTVRCSHGGTAEPTSSDTRVTIGGQAVLTASTPWPVVGCTLPPPPPGNGPCAAARWHTAASRVFVGGEPVLVRTGEAVCEPSGGPVVVMATQTRVTAL